AAAANFGLLRSRDGNDALEGRHLAEEPRLSRLVVIPLVIPVSRQARGKRLTLARRRRGFASVHRVLRPRRALIGGRARLSLSSRAGLSFVGRSSGHRPAGGGLLVTCIDVRLMRGLGAGA